MMMTAKDASGNRVFSSSEFLTVQQITSFFSRLASKRSLAGHLDIQAAGDDEDVEAEVNEAAFQELSDDVMANIHVQPTHPTPLRYLHCTQWLLALRTCVGSTSVPCARHLFR